ncbi:hypothetical protein LOTGIDRAFT_168137 [Lottia gigantea]|uniref:RING-type domain-containing protein n=1 Tax=Lottia gigantea TaxID=225164 RepID=V3ZVY5_LOTGI|nr:hypothetical protein LOTGIDRAFT_168137 [Lottia gigantea]ESO85111.1 hypothetical protein LOTGIDRAFT_168137 [Lottia gigantea]
MANPTEMNYLGGARPKTSVGSSTSNEKKKEKKHVDKSCKYGSDKCGGSPYRNQFLKSCSCCHNPEKERHRVIANDTTPNHTLEKDSTIFLDCEIQQGCIPIKNEFDLDNVNHFRRKLCYKKPVQYSCMEDSAVTGSLYNLTLDSNTESMHYSSQEDCTGVTLSDSKDFSSDDRTTDPALTVSCLHSNCTNSNPQAFVKWKTAGLALREVLSKKTNKLNKGKVSFPRDHLKSDHTRCWLQRLHDFDEYNEDFFTFCDCEDEETLTKTGSSSSLLSFDSANLSNPSNDSSSNIFQLDPVSSCSIPTIKRITIPIDQTSKDSEKTSINLESKSDSKSESKLLIKNNVCNSTVWEMLQKPYLSYNEDNFNKVNHVDRMNQVDNVQHVDKVNPLNQMSLLSHDICDISLCNNNSSNEESMNLTLPITISSHNNTQVEPNTSLLSSTHNFNSQQTQSNKQSDLTLCFDNLNTPSHLLAPNLCGTVDKNVNKSPVNTLLKKLVADVSHECAGSNSLSNIEQSSFEQSMLEQSSLNQTNDESTLEFQMCNCLQFVSSVSQPLLSSLNSTDLLNSHLQCANCLNINQNCDFYSNSQKSFPPGKCSICKIYHHPDSLIDMSTSSLLNESETINEESTLVVSKPKVLCESESDVTDRSSICCETSGEIYFSEGTDSSDLPSKLIRLNPTKNNTEYCAQSTSREKKKKVLHIRKSHRRSGSTSDSDINDEDHNEKAIVAPLEESNNILLSDILHPTTPLARFLKSHIPYDERSVNMPWENIEDGLSVESCADADSNHSLTGMSEGSSLRNTQLDPYLDTKTDEPLSQISQHIKKSSERKSMQARPSTTLRKLLNMEIHTELNGENSQYSPETWVRLVDQISLPFDCTEDDNSNDINNDNLLIDSTEKSNEFADLCLPNYDSSASCDADDEFECDCEHCQLLKIVGNTDNILATDNVDDNSPDRNNYNWPDFLEDDTSLDLDLSELRPLDPLLNNLQAIPQDLIDLMFQNVIMQMLAVHPELMGDQAPPPVPQHIIDSLPIVTTTQLHIDEEVSCPICLCPCQLEETLTILCCQHLFHPLCIQAWLAKSGTCPVCRCTINAVI